MLFFLFSQAGVQPSGFGKYDTRAKVFYAGFTEATSGFKTAQEQRKGMTGFFSAVRTIESGGNGSP